ncbi:MAG: hypothetical protein M1817_001339 [Caeruleum heppii]|nr:MAG: hypothetical protein M1817_001339 [Caeruleum heppii]
MIPYHRIYTFSTPTIYRSIRPRRTLFPPLTPTCPYATKRRSPVVRRAIQAQKREQDAPRRESQYGPPPPSPSDSHASTTPPPQPQQSYDDIIPRPWVLATAGFGTPAELQDILKDYLALGVDPPKERVRDLCHAHNIPPLTLHHIARFLRTLPPIPISPPLPNRLSLSASALDDPAATISVITEAIARKQHTLNLPILRPSLAHLIHLATHDKHPSAMALQARLLESSGKNLAASRMYEEACTVLPDDPPEYLAGRRYAALHRAHLLARRGRQEDMPLIQRCYESATDPSVTPSPTTPTPQVLRTRAEAHYALGLLRGSTLTPLQKLEHLQQASMSGLVQKAAFQLGCAFLRSSSHTSSSSSSSPTSITTTTDVSPLTDKTPGSLAREYFVLASRAGSSRAMFGLAVLAKLEGKPREVRMWLKQLEAEGDEKVKEEVRRVRRIWERGGVWEWDSEREGVLSGDGEDGEEG